MKKTNKSKNWARLLYPLLVMVLMVGASGSPAATQFKPQNPPKTNSFVTDTWAVEIQPNIDPNQLAAQLGAENLGPIGALPNMYLFRIVGSDTEAAATADVFALSDQVQWYQQQVARQLSKRAFIEPTDPNYAAQWHLQNTDPGGANVLNAWKLGPTNAGYTGDGVTIAIVDDGFDYTAEDLSGHYLPASSYDFKDNNADPFPIGLTDIHATSVAGVAGANRDGTACGVGVAYDANLASLRLNFNASTDAAEASALNYAYDTTSIYNNSWGPPDDGNSLVAPGPLTELALQRGAANGRNGKGNIYVWSAGNGRADGPAPYVPIPGAVNHELRDNINYDGYANSRFTIAVGAVGKDGKYAFYSEPGAAMVVTAPGGSGLPSDDANNISTTDLPGLEGYNNAGDCNGGFSGTSASAPVVSGVVALMLQRNPNLGWRDVQNILIRTAVKNDPTEPDWTTNGAGLHINHNYGFGLVDAAAAVAMANPATYTNLVSSPNIFSGVITNFSLTESLPQAMLDNDTTGVSSTYNAPQNITLEHVEVVLNATHTFRGDLKVVLTSPSGTQSVLANVHDDSDDNYNSWRFMTVRNWGESSAGNWTLKVSDESGDAVGTFDSWELNFYKEIKVADVSVSVAGVPKGLHSMVVGTGVRRSYNGVNDGPLFATSPRDFIIDTRVLYGGVSYSEMMGFPANKLTNNYWFPYYNNVAMNSQLRVSNLGASSTTITVTYGNNIPLDSYTLAAGAATRKNYAGINDGPLHVTSSTTNILSTLRVLYGGLSYSELTGFPNNQLTTDYWFPYYNNVAMNSQLRVSNVGGVLTHITVTYGNNIPLDSYDLAAGAATRKNYVGINDGPLHVTSSVSNILSTIRVVYGNQSFSEISGFPDNQLTTEYWYPVYDNTTLNSQLRVSNVGNASTTITVYGVSGTALDTYTLAVGAATRKNYIGINSGPLHVVSSGSNILSTQRLLYATPSFASFYELAGFPNDQITKDYYFPWYNNVAFLSQLRIAAP